MIRSGSGVVLLAVFSLLAVDSRGQGINDIQSQNRFGSAVAATQGDVLIGEPLNRRFSGRVYVFRKDTASGTWEETQSLVPPDGTPMNRFGSAIAASSDLVAIVASGEENDGVYVYRRDAGSSWIEEAVLRPNAESPFSKIGEAVAIAGGRVFTTLLTGDEGVRIVVFERSESDSTWVETEDVVELPIKAMEDVPRPVAASGDLLFVGAPSETGGAVFVLRREDDDWDFAQILKGEPTEGEGTSLFGASLSFSDGVLLVGAPESNDGNGVVYTFITDEDGEFERSGTLSAFGDSTLPLFGSVLSANSGFVLVGAYDPVRRKGGAYMFEAKGAGKFEPSQMLQGVPMDFRADFATALVLSDRVAVVGAKSDLFGYGSTYIYESSDREAGWVLTDQLKPSLLYRHHSITGGKVKCDEGKAGGFECRGVDIISFLSNEDLGNDWGVQTNDVWGWTDPQSGKEYAIVCTVAGTVFVDISDPYNPVVLGELAMTPGTRPNWWRDAKTYQNHVYIVADNVGNHGLQIFDLTQLRDVEDPPVRFEPTAHYDGFDSAHNIIINETTGYAYVVGINGGGNTCDGGSHILDLSEPTSPVFIGCFAHEGTGKGRQGYTHDAQCVVYHGPDERYSGKEICIGANETAISIADFTDKSNVTPIAVGRYPNSSYAHQGWLTEDHRYYFQNDEEDELNGLTAGTRTLVWDLAQLDDPILIDEHVSDNPAIDHNLYIKGSYMYQSNYLSGLRVFDISNPEETLDAGYFDTVPWGNDGPGFGGSWSNYPFFESGVIVVGSLEEGVFFLKQSEVAR